MPLTYSWHIHWIKKRTEVDSLNDVVIEISWSVRGTDENLYSVDVRGVTATKLDSLDPEKYIPFESLTEEIVLGWVKDSIYSEEIYYKAVDEAYDRLVNVRVIPEGQLPWDPPPAPPEPEPTPEPEPQPEPTSNTDVTDTGV